MSLKLPIVSIIISAYNETKYLPLTIDSILQQTCANFEVLIFSNHYNLIARWFRQKQDVRLKFIFQRNLGIAQTLNQGIFAARGKYLCFINAGDVWHSDKLQKQIFGLDHYPEVGLIHSWLMLIDSQGKSTGKIIKYKYLGWVKREILEPNQICLQSVMLRRNCFDMVGLFDPKLQATPSWDLLIRLSHHYQFMTIAEPLVSCRKFSEANARNWPIIETDLQTTIEQAYAHAPPDLIRLKPRSYADVSLYLAKRVLQDKPDLAIANNYCHQALEHDPLISLSSEFLRIRLKIIILHYLNSDRYSRLLLSIQAAQRLFEATINQIKEYGHSLLN